MVIKPIQNLQTNDNNLRLLINQLNIVIDQINDYTEDNDTDITALEAIPSIEDAVMCTVYYLHGDSSYNFINATGYSFITTDTGEIIGVG